MGDEETEARLLVGQDNSVKVRNSRAGLSQVSAVGTRAAPWRWALMPPPTLTSHFGYCRPAHALQVLKEDIRVVVIDKEKPRAVRVVLRDLHRSLGGINARMLQFASLFAGSKAAVSQAVEDGNVTAVEVANNRLRDAAKMPSPAAAVFPPTDNRSAAADWAVANGFAVIIRGAYCNLLGIPAPGAAWPPPLTDEQQEIQRALHSQALDTANLFSPRPSKCIG